MSQWGSEALARQGLDSVEILRFYYGDDIELVPNAPIADISQSYPGTPLQFGSTGPFVTSLLSALNRISQNYPAIPKISPVDGIFGEQTEAAVRQFQQIFSLAQDGIVGKATWYQINRIYVAVLRLAELQSQGQQQFFIGSYPNDLSLGDTGDYVRRVQYMLNVLSDFIPSIPPLTETGTYDIATRDAVGAFQQYAGLPITGAVDARTWDAIYEQFSSVESEIFDQTVLFPEVADFSDSSRIDQFPGQTLVPGSSDEGSTP